MKRRGGGQGDVDRRHPLLKTSQARSDQPVLRPQFAQGILRHPRHLVGQRPVGKTPLEVLPVLGQVLRVKPVLAHERLGGLGDGSVCLFVHRRVGDRLIDVVIAAQIAEIGRGRMPRVVYEKLAFYIAAEICTRLHVRQRRHRPPEAVGVHGQFLVRLDAHEKRVLGVLLLRHDRHHPTDACLHKTHLFVQHAMP
jgi:hypothetical protein